MSQSLRVSIDQFSSYLSISIIDICAFHVCYFFDILFVLFQSLFSFYYVLFCDQLSAVRTNLSVKSLNRIYYKFTEKWFLRAVLWLICCNYVDISRDFCFSGKLSSQEERWKNESENIVRSSCNKYRPHILTMNESLKKVNRVTTQFLDAHFENE